jgi:hypothetical protein
VRFVSGSYVLSLLLYSNYLTRYLMLLLLLRCARISLTLKTLSSSVLK